MSQWQLPVVDVERYRHGGLETKTRIAAEVDRGCRQVGFLLLEHHGVARPIIDRVFAVSRAFFDLPLAEKRRYHPRDPVAPRGYHALATRNLAKTLGKKAPPDLREQFFIGPLRAAPERYAEFEGAARFYSENIWPAHPADYRPALTEFYSALEVLARDVMRLFATALGEDERFFDDKIDHHFSTSPVNHYPVIEGPPAPGQLRAGAHTDFGSLTILAFDDAPGGLQVQMPDLTWLDVAPREDQLLVNIGDMMARWTNDRWRSTVHRVVNPPAPPGAGRRRMTAGYFLHPNYDADVSCLASCCGPDRPPRYRPGIAGRHMLEKMERGVDA